MEALRRERDLIARIAQTSPAGIAVVDRDGQITFANAQAERVLGLHQSEKTLVNRPQPTHFERAKRRSASREGGWITRG